MRHLSAALVTIAVIVPMVLGDMGYIPDPSDQRSYDVTASICLGLFIMLCLFDRGRDAEGRTISIRFRGPKSGVPSGLWYRTRSNKQT